MLELNKIYNMDCMEGMKDFPDNYFELAIVDPPYFSGPNKTPYYKGGNRKHYIKYRTIKNWKPADQNYINELKRISKNQIIWGINYYAIEYLGSGRIIWDKKNDNPGNDFSDCEIAYCNIFDSVRIFRYLWCGFLQENLKKGREIKIHPTQKPVALYRWLLQNYATKGDKSLTHILAVAQAS
jgi:site-specific DNA-methyltransferase (adenine-specific)